MHVSVSKKFSCTFFASDKFHQNLFVFTLLLLKGVWLQNSSTATCIIQHNKSNGFFFYFFAFTFRPCGHPRQLSGARQLLLGMYTYLSDLLSYVCSFKRSALYEDQRTALSFYVTAKIVPMKVQEVSICKPRHWNLGIGIGTDVTNAIISSSIRTANLAGWQLRMRRPHPQS